MKVSITQDKSVDNIEVEIKYSEMTDEVYQIRKRLESFEKVLVGNIYGKQYPIRISDIYYIESVDRKTFIYTKDNVFRSELKLYVIKDELPSEEFVQVSKSCILNINILEYIENCINSKLEATLSNGEKICISRTYIPLIKKIVFGGDKN